MHSLYCSHIPFFVDANRVFPRFGGLGRGSVPGRSVGWPWVDEPNASQYQQDTCGNVIEGMFSVSFVFAFLQADFWRLASCVFVRGSEGPEG